ncbi:uncharacterized protein LOC129599047 [Paramacrobiotus metropolitanus]|uniref:uncharacterized protein LOC129599047 n=1 Tax=Paramacrobiotus metropolitanus TaxID=2943436 RepID=UPI0024457DC6|nr:uncharacterized protein LOC129599047 [Paramacrobiotus metropolitanus]
MQSNAAILTLWTTVTLLLHHSSAESGDPTVETGLNTLNAAIKTVSGNPKAEKPTETRSFAPDLLQTFLKCPDPLMNYGCRECEKSCANPNPPVLCVYDCHNTCVCKFGLYRTFLPSPTCAPPNGPVINNCKGAPKNVKG